MNHGDESSSVDLSEKQMSNLEIANQVISKYTSSNSSTTNKRKSIPIVKDDEEYSKKRQRNNIAVKKSREKAKNRIQETQERVEQLSKENEDLQTKVTLLSKELNVLRALFTNGGFSLPCDLQLMNGGSNTSDLSPVSQYSPLASNPEDSVRHYHLTPFHGESHGKSAFHTPDDTKIPPLRPMPRIPPKELSSVNHKMHQDLIPSRSYSAKRDLSCKKYSKSEVKSESGRAPPLLLQSNVTLPSSNSHTHFMTSASHYKQETQHTSVIRSASELNRETSSSIDYYSLIQGENNGVKIVPLSA